MSSIQETRGHARPLLLLIDESADLVATVRSGERRVLRWSPTADGDGCFVGDLADVATYECARGAMSVTAVIDVDDDARAEAALAALRQVRPDAAVLVLSRSVDHAPGDGTLTRAGTLRDVLRLDLEEELRRLEAQRRAWCLRSFVEPEAVVPILIHPDPDPDAISSALAVRTLLGRDAQSLPILALGELRRPENLRMAELLQVHIEIVGREALAGWPRLITVDMQPAGLVDGGTRLAVIDHHPPEAGYDAEFLDVRCSYGAVASMVTEYLRAEEPDAFGEQLATALLHGIKTDTDSLTRGVSPADVESYAFLQARCDLALLRRIERPSFSAEAARTFGRALDSVCVDGGWAVCYAGELPTESAHLLAEIADFCTALQDAVVVAAVARVGGELVFVLRQAEREGPAVGRIAKAIASAAGSEGKGGGHATMARAALPEDRIGALVGEELDSASLLAFLQQAAAGTQAD